MHDGKYKNEKFLYIDLNMTDKYHPNMIDFNISDDIYRMSLSTYMKTSSIVSSDCKDKSTDKGCI